MIKIIDLPAVLISMGFTPAEFEVWDDGNGNGAYIKSWLSLTVPEPTREEIEAAYTQLTQAPIVIEHSNGDV